MGRVFCWVLLSLPLVLAAAAAPRAPKSSLAFDNIPEPPPALTDRLDAYLHARAADVLGWSPKGGLLISTRFGDIDQLHLVAGAGGERRQLTFVREPVTQGAFSPDPGRSAFWYLQDHGGDENFQLYYQRVGEPARLLTDGKSRNGAAVWSNAGREIAFASNARDGVTDDVDVIDPESGALPRLALTGDGGEWLPLDWSADDRRLLVLKRVSATEDYLYVVELDSGQKHEVDPAPVKRGITAARFSRDGQGVYVISDRDGDFRQLRFVDFFTGRATLISGQIPWDIDEFALSRDGGYLAYVSNEGGIGKLNLLDLRAHQDLTPPHLPGEGQIGALAFDAQGKRLAFRFEAVDRPGDAYVLEMASGRFEAWTHSEAGPLDTAQFVHPRPAGFPSFDRPAGRPRRIPAFIFEPAGPGPHPVLIVLHGGREQFRPGFDPWIQFVVDELGFAVVAPDVRGSSGYGKDYAALADGRLREDAVKDIGALLVWLGGQTSMDAQRVVVAGGGAGGGYLALASLVNYGDRLRGGVDQSGITDFVAFLADGAADRQRRYRAEYGDERDPDSRAFLRRISPLSNADRIARPLLIVHGGNDPLVPLRESEQLVSRLRRDGAEVWYLSADDEGRTFRRRRNRDAYLSTFAQFLAARR